MSDPLKGKRPGSASWRQVSSDRSLIAARDAEGKIIPKDDAVGIDYVCHRVGHGVMGQFRMSTMDDSDRSVVMLKLPDGTLPEAADWPGKPMLLCSKCRNDVRRSASQIEADLNAIWEPHSRRVVSCQV